LIAGEVDRELPAAPSALAAAIVARHGRAVAAVLLYGSGLRLPDPSRDPDSDVVYDFYVFVDRYRDIDRRWVARVANAVLPPSVFYTEIPSSDGRLRAKYAVMTLARFSRAVSGKTFHSYFWARFAQPVRLAYARDSLAREAVVNALAQAVVTVVARTAGLMQGPFLSRDLWIRAFRESYAAELRAERPDRPNSIHAWNSERYARLTAPALEASGIPQRASPVDDCFEVALSVAQRRRVETGWRVRRIAGKVLSALRLANGLFTFEGGIDYILWKIERHSGVSATLTPWQRRHPLLASPIVAWRLYRLGAFR
jgi:hypothetical protein